MGGEERRQRSMLIVVNLEQRIPRDHPLRRIKQLAEAALQELSPTFEQMYSRLGRPSIVPERLMARAVVAGVVLLRGGPKCETGSQLSKPVSSQFTDWIWSLSCHPP
jgi:hypothetical protein